MRPPERGRRLVLGLPTGIVTVLFTDIEGSTALLQHVGDQRHPGVLAEHRPILRAAFQAGGGHEIDTQGRQKGFRQSAGKGKGRSGARRHVQCYEGGGNEALSEIPLLARFGALPLTTPVRPDRGRSGEFRA